MTKNKKQGFTLVELIVVITILAILGTIAFISFQGYSLSARDSARVSDIGVIKRSLEFYKIQTGTYPEPDNSVTISYSGAGVRSQGIFGEASLTQVGKMSKKPIDPLTGTEYTFSRLNTKGEYEIGAVLEQGFAFDSLAQTYAAGKEGIALVTGTYNGAIAKTNTGGISYILAVPSIISSDVSLLDIESIIAANKVVINGQSNLPANYEGSNFDVSGDFTFAPNNLVVYSGSSLPSTDGEIAAFVVSLQNAYSGTTVEDSGVIAAVLDVSPSDTDQLVVLGSVVLTGDVEGIISSGAGSSSGGGGCVFGTSTFGNCDL